MNFESQPEHSGNSFLRKKFKELPIFFPVDYQNSNALGTVVSEICEQLSTYAGMLMFGK
jgi:hypothetical protein